VIRFMVMACVAVWALAIFGAPDGLAQSQDLCEDSQAGWASAQEALKKDMAESRRIKELSIEERLFQEIKRNGKSRSIAADVQSVLKERSDVLAEANRRCLQAASKEKAAFDEWRKCVFAGRSRKRGNGGSGMELIAAERKRLSESLNELLLDEGHAQYKNYQAPAPPANWGYEQQGQPSRNVWHNGYPNYEAYR
jgi:hypothetical protein